MNTSILIDAHGRILWPSVAMIAFAEFCFWWLGIFRVVEFSGLGFGKVAKGFGRSTCVRLLALFVGPCPFGYRCPPKRERR